VATRKQLVNSVAVETPGFTRGCLASIPKRAKPPASAFLFAPGSLREVGFFSRSLRLLFECDFRERSWICSASSRVDPILRCLLPSSETPCSDSLWMKAVSS